MHRLIECVPNFSEGRNLATLDAIVHVMSGIAGAWILDRSSDADHNRSVITLAGKPEAVAEAVLRGAGKAAELIDLTSQTGLHPRIGATDVIPFVPLEGITVEECVALARRVGQELWNRYRVPVYFYEAAATRPDRVNLANVRKGQFEGLRRDAPLSAERAPDVGEPRPHPTAGATAVGVRKLLVAYNIYLNTSDVSVARDIARTIRASGGGLPHVKAMGVEMKTRGLAQVSMNLTDFEQTSVHVAFETVKREAQRRGFAVVSSEIVGLIPRKAIELSTEDYLLLENFSSAQVLENRLASVSGILPPPPAPSGNEAPELQPLLDTLREAVRELSERALDAAAEPLSGPEAPAAHSPEEASQLHLHAALAAANIYERLVQLEATSAPSMLLGWLVVKQAAAAAARGAMENAEALFPSLRDASTVARIKSVRAEIDGKLSGKPAAAGR